MLRFLFPRLTATPERGAELFAAVTDRARDAHWYVAGQVPDTLDGRFRMLATLAALVAVRLECEGQSGDAASVALTERFAAVMESEHRELGLGDPTLGKRVRELVGSLARRIAIWRMATAGGDWHQAARDSLYQVPADDGAVDHTATALRRFWDELGARPLADVTAGRLA